MSYLRKKKRPDTVYWVGYDNGTPLGSGAQHVYVTLPPAKGIVTGHRRRREHWISISRLPHTPPIYADPDPAVWVGTVTWKKLED